MVKVGTGGLKRYEGETRRRPFSFGVALFGVPLGETLNGSQEIIRVNAGSL
jgi:hypothetical protein